MFNDLCNNCKFAEYDSNGCYCKKHSALVYGIHVCDYFESEILCNTCAFADQLETDHICFCNYYNDCECTKDCTHYKKIQEYPEQDCDLSEVNSDNMLIPIKCTCGGNPTISIETDNEAFYLYRCKCIKCNKDVSIRLTTLTIPNLNTVISLWNDENINSDLKPCPFCGGGAELKDGIFSVCGEYQNVVYVKCQDCGAMVKIPNKDNSKLTQYRTECKELWNKRVKE